MLPAVCQILSKIACYCMLCVKFHQIVQMFRCQKCIPNNHNLPKIKEHSYIHKLYIKYLLTTFAENTFAENIWGSDLFLFKLADTGIPSRYLSDVDMYPTTPLSKG